MLVSHAHKVVVRANQALRYAPGALQTNKYFSMGHAQPSALIV